MNLESWGGGTSLEPLLAFTWHVIVDLLHVLMLLGWILEPLGTANKVALMWVLARANEGCRELVNEGTTKEHIRTEY